MHITVSDIINELENVERRRRALLDATTNREVRIALQNLRTELTVIAAYTEVAALDFANECDGHSHREDDY